MKKLDQWEKSLYTVDDVNLKFTYKVISFKNASAMLIFYCFSANVFLLSISGYATFLIFDGFF